MISIAGRQLISSQLINISPLDYPLRTLFFIVPILVFAFYSLQLLRNLNKGVTLALPKSGLPLPHVLPGKAKKSPKYSIQHYDNSYLTGFLGLLFFAASEFFVVIMFKAVTYTFF